MADDQDVERIELDVFSEASNQAIVRMPGRRFPGVVIQGDTLSGLVLDAKNILRELRAGNEPIQDARYLVERLTEYLDHYERTLAAHDIPLPYPSEG
jgi:hypothetical protein